MIRINWAAVVVVIFSCCFSSCGSDPQPQPQIQVKQGWAQFTLDNVVWEAPATISGSYGMLTANRGTEVLNIQFSNLGTGTYNLSTSPMPYIGLQNGNGNFNSYICSPAGGRIIVTEYDGATMSGTFTAKICTSSGQSKDIVNGRFTKINITQ